MPERRPAVLVVTDDSDIANALDEMLFAVVNSLTAVETEREAAVALRRRRFDLVLADFRDGRLSPYKAMSGIRRCSHVPVIALASQHGEPAADCLELGADDCVSWPASPRELRARVRLRGTPTGVASGALVFGGLAIDTHHRKVALRSTQVDVTDREFDLLVYLARTPGHPVSTNQLLDAVWHSNSDWQTSRTVAEHVYRLRKKLEANPSTPKRILTVRGLGYCFSA